MILCKGKISTKDLAKWFGISYNTLRGKKKEKLKELSFYCDFEEVYGGIIVKEVYCEEYIKPCNTYDFVKNNFLKYWHKSKKDQAARVAKELYEKHKNNELKNVKLSTVKNYVLKARTELYGHVYLDDHGINGSCHSVAVAENKWEEVVDLTEEQYRIYKECIREAYYSEEEAEIKIAAARGEISKNEYKQIFGEINSEEKKQEQYLKYIFLCEDRLGFCPVKVTELADGLYFS